MCNNPRYFENIFNPYTGKKYPIPCRHCQGCRIDRRTMWERRITAEYIKHRCAFVTLTYSDYFLPYNEGAIMPTLRHKDLKKYLDNLRHQIKNMKDELFTNGNTKEYKTVAVGEYGEKGGRPHYHILFLGLDWKTFQTQIKKAWSEKGIVDVGPIKKGGIRYILKYMDKQQFGTYRHAQYTDQGREIPKMSFSKGIGKDWIISQGENIQKYGAAKAGQRLIPIPSYWKNKLMNYCEENIFSIMKRQNEYARKMNAQCQAMGFADYDQYLRTARKVKERALELQCLKNKTPKTEVSNEIATKQLPIGHEFTTDYTKEVWRGKHE